MRKVSQLFRFNRVAFHHFDEEDFYKSVLAYLCADEYRFLNNFLKRSGLK